MPKPPKCRIAIYASVSILDQDPQMQLRELRAYAKHRTWDCLTGRDMRLTLSRATYLQRAMLSVCNI